MDDWHDPDMLPYRWDDWIFLALLTAMIVSGLYSAGWHS
jgi:hypothetical protein